LADNQIKILLLEEEERKEEILDSLSTQDVINMAGKIKFQQELQLIKS
jgi:hypothetical protein